MPRLRFVRMRVAASLALGAVGPVAVLAEDPAPAPPAAAARDQAATLARADALQAEMFRLYGAGKYEEATPVAREVLALREKALGPDHLDVGSSLSNLARLLGIQAEYAEARPLYERALAIHEKALGKEDPAVGMVLSNLGCLLKDQGDFAGARQLLERALAVREKARGKQHPDVATSLNNLATVLMAQGALSDARRLTERALAIDETALGKDHPTVGVLLGNLAGILKEQGRFAEAMPFARRALEISEAALGKDDPDVAFGLNTVASLLKDQGAFREARAPYERALAIRVKAFGMEHPAVAESLNNLALVFDEQGIYAEARPRYERALAIRERVLGKDHPDVAQTLNNLACLLESLGAYAEARPLVERALAIREKVLGKDHRDVATTLNNLALLLGDQGKHEEARPLLERALAISEKALGPDHPDAAQALNSLASTFLEQGAFREARPLLERAVAIDEHALGKDHPFVATDLHNLALVLKHLSEFHEARTLNERALAIRVRALGPEHPDVATSLNGLAQLLEAQGEFGEAKPLYLRALTITEAHARAQLSALTARQRLGLLRSTRVRLESWVRIAPRVGESGYPEVLRFRGLAARAETAERVLSRHATGEDRRKQDELRTAQHRVARLANGMPSSFKPAEREEWQREYAGATAERERLTLELTRAVAPLRPALERLELGMKEVQASLGPDTALVDFLRVGARYFAWIVRATGEPVRIDVGAVDAIDGATKVFLDDVARGRDVAEGGAALRARVWTPVAAALGDGVARVVICPDGALATVPFAALPGKTRGTFLLDDLAVSYVMNAQDLVPWKDAPPLGTGALLVGGVDYERADGGTPERPLAQPPIALGPLDRAPRGERFTPLPQTRVEVDGLRGRLGSGATTLLLGADATEARLRAAVKGRRYVHIATHGFAREDLLAGLYTRRIEETFTSADMERQLSVGHDPMLLSGLAMAGANPREGAAGDDGILTALEASYLDLDGVDLVTLSACETARGTAESGEGVLGLVSAFQMAGARRIVASLWRVDDEGTRRLMDGLYERMLRTDAPLPPADALREASLALRAWKDADGVARFAAPRYWASFVAYGR